MLMKRVVVALVTIVVLSITPRPAVADQILITGGGLQMGSFTGSITLSGERGFTLNASVSVIDSLFVPWTRCVTPCAPGTAVGLTGTFTGSSLHSASATLDGQTFTMVGGIASPTSAALFFTGNPVLLPSPDQEFITLVAPFLFNGAFSSQLFLNPDGTGNISETLAGQGSAFLTLQRSLLTPDGSPGWRYTSAVYSFEDATAPIPEPATMLLTGAGLALLARRRWSRARKAEASL
jgi:hypothetical protein